jgi:hypothetical protein
VAIYSQLSEAAFDPAAIQTMTAAYEITLTELQLIDRNHPVTRQVAEAVILVYRAGYTEPEPLCKRALKELGIRGE